jgi:predicted RNA-binding protein with PIN domain
MPESWIIDGYNLLHSVSLNPNKGKPMTRERMLGMLAGFASLNAREVLVVLDGVGKDDELASYHTKNFKVQYSQSVSADTVIERILYEKKTLSGIKSGVAFVVTDDRAIVSMARGFGAIVFSTQDFSEMLKESQKDEEDTLFSRKVSSHGFHRPFHDKLK